MNATGSHCLASSKLKGLMSILGLMILNICITIAATRDYTREIRLIETETNAANLCYHDNAGKREIQCVDDVLGGVHSHRAARRVHGNRGCHCEHAMRVHSDDWVSR